MDTLATSSARCSVSSSSVRRRSALILHKVVEIRVLGGCLGGA
jgi:hypothetical protein